MRHMCRVANQVFQSKNVQIFVYIREDPNDYFWCKHCGSGHQIAQGTDKVYIYIYTLVGSSYDYVLQDIMCERCHKGVQHRLLKKAIRRDRVTESTQVTEFRKSVQRLKKQLKLAKKVGFYS